jgi:hypothetical protein
VDNIKLLISALPAIGKTTLLQNLEDTLVIARDGKKYPFAQPHVNVPNFTSIDEVIDLIIEKVEAYEEKMGKPPKIIAIDSISKIVLDIEAYVLDQVKSFPYGKVNTEIKKFVDFIETEICENFDVILVSHALFHEDVSGYQLVNAGGSYGKKGGMLSEVDEALFIEMKGKKRIIHYRNPRLVARTTVGDLPDSVDLTAEWSLQDHINLLKSKQGKASEWSL